MKKSPSLRLSFGATLNKVINGYHGWGLIRTLIILLMVFVGGVIFALILEYPSLSSLAARYQEQSPLLKVIPIPLFAIFLSFFTWKTIRLYLLAFLPIIFSLFIGGKYLQDIYNLTSIKSPLSYLFSTLTGLHYPTLKIGQVDPHEKKRKPNYLSEIGGPGKLMIQAGYVVLISHLRALSNIYTEGKHFLSRNEKVEDTLNLNDQQDTIEKLEAYTKDGIAIKVSDIHFGYRLRTAHPTVTETNGFSAQPYSISLEAVNNLTQSRVVTESGLTDWRTMVKGIVRSAIADFIYNHTATELLKPAPTKNPYTELKNSLNKRGFRERLRKMGTELLWINLGFFDFGDERLKQEILNLLGEEWSDQIDLELAEGDAQLIYYQELGRAEAQAEILQGIIEALNSAPTDLDSLELIRSIILSRASQVFESFGINDHQP